MKCAAIGALLLAAAQAFAIGGARAAWVIAPRADAAAGETLLVDVVLINDTDRPLATGLPERLPARLTQGVAAVNVALERQMPSAVGPVAPGQFRRATYAVRVPAEFAGTVQLALAIDEGPRALFVATAPTAAKPPTPVLQPADAAEAPPAPRGAENAAAIDRNVAAGVAALSPHEPMYFIGGSRGPTTGKFQLSLKYRLLDGDTWLGRRVAPLAKVHVGYTQTSLWDLGRDSRPFRDTSYRPSIFYYEPEAWRSVDARYGLSFSTGYEHESNGKDGDSSRSVNTVFARPRLRVSLDDGYFVRLEPKLYRYIGHSGNEDIARYRGHGDYAFAVGHSDDWLLNTTLRHGSAGHTSVQVDGSWRIRARVFANASGFLYAQYFNGYGDSLLDYNIKRRAQFRIGFGIVR